MLIIKGFMRVSLTEMKLKFFPFFRNEAEIVASWGDACLLNYLDGTLVLKGGAKADRLAAYEWISLFWHEAVVGDGSGWRALKSACMQTRTPLLPQPVEN
jgi:hypothetical protein